MSEEQNMFNARKMPSPVYIATIIVALAAVGAAAYFFYQAASPAEFAQPALPPVPGSAIPTTPVPEEESLGGTLYEKANNPLEDKLPEAAPMVNPLDDAYKNPF